MTLSELKNKYRKLTSLEKARSGWEDEYEVSSKQVSILNSDIFITIMLTFLTEIAVEIQILLLLYHYVRNPINYLSKTAKNINKL